MGLTMLGVGSAGGFKRYAGLDLGLSAFVCGWALEVRVFVLLVWGVEWSGVVDWVGAWGLGLGGIFLGLAVVVLYILFLSFFGGSCFVPSCGGGEVSGCDELHAAEV